MELAKLSRENREQAALYAKKAMEHAKLYDSLTDQMHTSLLFKGQNISPEEKAEYASLMKRFGLAGFAGAAMFVMQHIFGLDEEHTLIKPNERDGKFLLREIMIAGNFGKYDERLQYEQGESGLHWGLRKVVRNFRFVSSYPSEVIWSPLFKLWHYFWRRTL